MSLTSEGLSDDTSVIRAKKALTRASKIATAITWDASSPMRRVEFILVNFLRSSYLYNAILLDNVSRLDERGKEIIMNIFKTILNGKDRVLLDKAITKLTRL